MSRTGIKPAAPGKPTKKGICATALKKYCLPKRAHVLFSAPILFARD
jgi:hypothetical protein